MTRSGSAVGPAATALYTSGRTSNEAAFLYQLFVRAYGTNNLPDCSNMCHESSGNALLEKIERQTFRAAKIVNGLPETALQFSGVKPSGDLKNPGLKARLG